MLREFSDVRCAFKHFSLGSTAKFRGINYTSKSLIRIKSQIFQMEASFQISRGNPLSDHHLNPILVMTNRWNMFLMTTVNRKFRYSIFFREYTESILGPHITGELGRVPLWKSGPAWSTPNPIQLAYIFCLLLAVYGNLRCEVVSWECMGWAYRVQW